MIRNACPGERVEIVNVRPSLAIRLAWLPACNTGTITRRELFYGQSPSLWVTPDCSGVGETRFRPCELKRTAPLARRPADAGALRGGGAAEDERGE